MYIRELFVDNDKDVSDQLLYCHDIMVRVQ